MRILASKIRIDDKPLFAFQIVNLVDKAMKQFLQPEYKTIDDAPITREDSFRMFRSRCFRKHTNSMREYGCKRSRKRRNSSKHSLL